MGKKTRLIQEKAEKYEGVTSNPWKLGIYVFYASDTQFYSY